MELIGSTLAQWIRGILLTNVDQKSLDTGGFDWHLSPDLLV